MDRHSDKVTPVFLIYVLKCTWMITSVLDGFILSTLLDEITSLIQMLSHRQSTIDKISFPGYLSASSTTLGG